MIPRQLEGWQFIFITKDGKIPTPEMSGWAKDRINRTYKIDSPELIKHIQNCGNYGVLADSDRFILASDNKEIESVIENSLPPTFTVRSPRHKTKHFYYYGSIRKNLNYKENPEGDPCLDVRKGNSYVLGASSIFGEYGDYKVVDDRPIATTTEEAVINATKKYLKELKKPETTTNSFIPKIDDISFPITNLPISISGKKTGNEILTSHPTHGSTTGSNFSINQTKNLWHCFRHNTGGSSLELLAVMEGLITCEKSQSGCLKGELFLKVVEIAIEKGFLPEDVLKPKPLSTFTNQTINVLTPGCEKNLLTDNPKIINKNALTGGDALMTLDELESALDATVKGDKINRLILLIGSLLNYTEQDQLNFGQSGDSASGKSHLSISIADLHPKHCVIELSYTSPKAFFHDKGIVIEDETDEPIIDKEEFVKKALEKWAIENPKPELQEGKQRDPKIKEWTEKYVEAKQSFKRLWDKTPKHIRVDLKQKILVFIDMPSPELLTYLRSLLSHDKPSIWVKITDRGASGGNQTKNVEIVGFPTLFFNSTNFTLDAQEQTRLFLLSPEISIDKFEKTLPFIAKKLCNRNQFNKELDGNELRNKLIKHIVAISELGVKEIIIPTILEKEIIDKFLKEHQNLIPRFQRDLPRLIALIKGFTLFNYPNRELNDNVLTATKEDVNLGYDLYAKVSKSNELGLPPYIYDFYQDVLLPTFNKPDFEGFTRKDLSRQYYLKYRNHLGDKQRSKIVDLLSETGLVIEEKDPSDKKTLRIYNALENPEFVETIQTMNCDNCGEKLLVEPFKTVNLPNKNLCHPCFSLHATEDERGI